MSDCVFCKIISGEMASHKVYEDEHVFAFLDIRPVNPGHTLIIPKNHAANMLESSEEDVCHVSRVSKMLAPAILKAVGAEAFNFSTNCGRASGQIVFHTHFHLIPRFPTDGYEHWQSSDDNHNDLQAMIQKIQAALHEGKNADNSIDAGENDGYSAQNEQ